MKKGEIREMRIQSVTNDTYLLSCPIEINAKRFFNWLLKKQKSRSKVEVTIKEREEEKRRKGEVWEKKKENADGLVINQ